METKRLNIKSNSTDWRAKLLANPTNTPFKIGNFIFPSVESPLQGIKFSNESKQREIFAMRGIDALKAGRKITKSIQKDKTAYVYWDKKQIIYNSIEHRLLIAMFIHEKVRQNKKVQEALLATSGSFIYHDVGMEHPSTSLPEKFYIQILLAQRDLLQKLQQIS